MQTPSLPLALTLDDLVADPALEEVWVNGPDQVFVAENGISRSVPMLLSAMEIRGFVERVLRQTGRRVDVSSPFVDASLPDGSRLHVVIPDITKEHWSVNVRKFSQSLRSLGDLVEVGVLSHEAADYLRDAVTNGQSVLVSGATQAGKTTMLMALLDAISDSERVVTVEETFELVLHRPDHVGMQCRGESLEGTGEVTLRRLVKEALRMRPDRLVVGEVREAEALDLLIALNSGLPGMCSIHAKSAHHALVKLCTLPLLAGRNIDHSFVLPTVAGTIDLVVYLGRGVDGIRRVMDIIAPTGAVVDGAVLVALRNHGFDSYSRLERFCEPSSCLSPGAAVTIRVSVQAPLFSHDFLPGVLGAEWVTVSAESTRLVSRYGVPW